MTEKQIGFFHDPSADPQAWVFGATSKITAPILQADRNWSAFANTEIQVYPWGDTFECGWINSFDPLEMLIKRKYGLTRNYSQRAMAKYTSTDKIKGSDPHKNAEILRTEGAPFESRWPSLRDIASFAEYYAPLPQFVKDAFADFRSEFELKHDTIVGGPEAIWDALQYSPVGVSVGWNVIDENGYWWKQGTHEDFHWTVVIGGEYGKYLLAQDSAEPLLKKIRWADFKPLLAKRYDVTKRTEAIQISLMQRVIVLLKQMIAKLQGQGAVESPALAPISPVAPSKPPVAPTPVKPVKTAPERLYAAAKAALGKDLSQKAPDERGCSEAASRIIAKIIPSFPIILSTITLQKTLENHHQFREIKVPQIGCVTIFATVGNVTGHVGIFGANSIMSNDSATGLFKANYTHAAWLAAAKKRGLIVRNFLPLL
ncbi:hypothetical protein [Bradyrhizobium sp. AUGA SZCCT0431]|uniref:hypothetical protein n=1 Tax=Bradyrhizobium sp. AUGA SZCCT0431 TaxID=2807674 RepID=UPI001BAC861C|nr:hypothetical protein [Bradyrhizobium sp. AUGA SZCCT0431]MBR1146668.1 hypothetical protein [Bradyrhizobium sp. AUGA SZCCT0431]